MLRQRLMKESEGTWNKPVYQGVSELMALADIKAAPRLACQRNSSPPHYGDPTPIKVELNCNQHPPEQIQVESGWMVTLFNGEAPSVKRGDPGDHIKKY